MAKKSEAQNETIARVMHEFKQGELTIGANGPPVGNAKQAIAVALREAGASNRVSAKKNRAALRETKRKEAENETRADLYREAGRRGVVGRSRMSKDALRRALGG